MIVVELPTGKIGITFEHPQNEFLLPGGPTGPQDVIDILTQRKTICKLFDVERYPFTCVAQGVANCHEKDQFVKATGRRLALTRALKSANYGRKSREVVWNAYLSRGLPASIRRTAPQPDTREETPQAGVTSVATPNRDGNNGTSLRN